MAAAGSEVRPRRNGGVWRPSPQRARESKRCANSGNSPKTAWHVCSASRTGQTVSAIDTGDRGVTAEELLLAVEKLGASLEYFTDPFLLAGEGRFSWRHTGVDAQRLAACEHSSGRWIAAFRTLALAVGRETPLLRRALGLTRRSRFEDAMRAGERFAAEFGLGAAPATRLSEAMERELGILVLMVDADRDISGAACRLREMDAVLIARREVAGRRHFDLAHELFPHPDLG